VHGRKSLQDSNPYAFLPLASKWALSVYIFMHVFFSLITVATISFSITRWNALRLPTSPVHCHLRCCSMVDHM
jgi:hypothetical protein